MTPAFWRELPEAVKHACRTPARDTRPDPSRRKARVFTAGMDFSVFTDPNALTTDSPPPRAKPS